jgi:serine/threonine protein kinase
VADAQPGPSPSPSTESAAAHFEARIGTTIDDRYAIEEVLGAGGMGVVFRAQQTSMHRAVALKMLHPSFAAAPEFYERFRREAELISHLHHPHIISIFDFGKTSDGSCYYVMELVKGESLKEKVKREGAFTLARAARITEQIARALGTAHAAGIVHRDLKPHNVMCSVVDGQDFSKVLDFGLVKMIIDDPNTGVVPAAQEGLTVAGQVLGTPQYMAPEQAAGESVDARADLYSLGTVFYYMLTGVPPYGEKTVRAALKAAATKPVPPVSDRRQDAPVPEALEVFFRRVLSFEPDQRPASAEVFVQELQEAVSHASPAMLERLPKGSTAPTDVKQSSGTTRTTVRYRSPFRRALPFAVLALLGLGGAGGWFWTHRDKTGGKRTDGTDGVSVLVPPLPAKGKVEIVLEYSTEKKQWIETETAAFSKLHPDTTVKLVGKGSLEAAEGIAKGEDKPTVWSPADSIALALGSDAFQKTRGAKLLGDEGSDDAPQPLVLTPLVLVIWAERETILHSVNAKQSLWQALHAAVTNPKGWAGAGGHAGWGPVKVAHTDPLRSNSGLQVLLLMTGDHFHRPDPRLEDLKDPGYLQWLRESEAGKGKLENSTGTLMTDMLRYGPSRYDAAWVYESLAIETLGAANSRWGDLQVHYPPVTSWSDHPAALLQGAWVTEAQKGAARDYIAFLRGHAAQQDALTFGFRPGDPNIPLKSTDETNPFTRLAKSGIRLDLPSASSPPTAEFTRALLETWRTQVIGAAQP